MGRREFITLLGGAAAAWPLAAGAQQSGKLPTIGFLGGNTWSTQGQFTSAFVGGLRDLGWREGHNVIIEYRWAEGRAERFAEIAAEFVRLKVDVIVTATTAPTLAAMRATSVIPIVFAAVGDPVGAGLVASLARPGGNVTGLSSQLSELFGKHLDLMREALPSLRRVAHMANVERPGILADTDQFDAAAHKMGLETIRLRIRAKEDIALALDSVDGRVDALWVYPEPLAFTNRVRINTLAVGARMPTMHGAREYVESGGLMSYSANIAALYRQSAKHVDKILHGAKPGELPVEQPTKFELVVNLITARAIRLSIPATLLARADEVIE
jgi:putative tryptophan/tyrosine transport system substrate-binding protein